MRKNNKKNLKTELVNLERKSELTMKILGWNREEIDRFSMQQTLHSFLTFTGTKLPHIAAGCKNMLMNLPHL